MKKEGKKINIYKFFWSRIGGRPWTFIVRDAWHKVEWLWLVGLVFIGAVMGRCLWEYVPWILLIFCIGYIAGHLFWGKEYIPDQKVPGKDKGADK